MTAIDDTLSDLQTDADSSLSYRIRQPAPLKPKRCLILLHGVGGNETNLPGLAEGVDPDTLVVLARGPLKLGPQQFAWFRVVFTATGPDIVAEEAERSRLALIQFVAQIQARYGIASHHTVIAGFSQGGVLSASVALTQPESVSGFAVLSGRILPELKPLLADKEGLSKVKGFIGHGEFDSKLPVHWAHRASHWLTELGIQHALHLYPIEHSISAAMHADFVQWLARLE